MWTTSVHGSNVSVQPATCKTLAKWSKLQVFDRRTRWTRQGKPLLRRPPRISGMNSGSWDTELFGAGRLRGIEARRQAEELPGLDDPGWRGSDAPAVLLRRPASYLDSATASGPVCDVLHHESVVSSATLVFLTCRCLPQRFATVSVKRPGCWCRRMSSISASRAMATEEETRSPGAH